MDHLVDMYLDGVMRHAMNYAKSVIDKDFDEVFTVGEVSWGWE